MLRATSQKTFCTRIPAGQVRLQLLILVTRTLAGWFLAIKLSCSPIFMLIALVLLRPLSCLLGPSSTVHGGRRWLRLSRFSRRRGPLLSFLLLCFKVFLLAHFYVDRPCPPSSFVLPPWSFVNRPRWSSMVATFSIFSSPRPAPFIPSILLQGFLARPFLC